MIKQPTPNEEDDGRTVCNMDVEGMPWHDKRVRREVKAASRKTAAPGEQMTRSEARIFTWYAVLAGMLVAFVFSVVWVLFILFCTQVWFR